MKKKARKTVHKPTRKAARQAQKPQKAERPALKTVPVDKPRDSGPQPGASVEPLRTREEPVVHGGRIEIAIDRIEGETIIGDLMVVFPRTREVLKRYGLNLDVEEAGDIYMSLDAFAALKGLKPETLVRDLETASKELPPPAAPTAVTPIP